MKWWQKFVCVREIVCVYCVWLCVCLCIWVCMHLCLCVCGCVWVCIKYAYTVIYVMYMWVCVTKYIWRDICVILCIYASVNYVHLYLPESYNVKPDPGLMKTQQASRTLQHSWWAHISIKACWGMNNEEYSYSLRLTIFTPDYDQCKSVTEPITNDIQEHWQLFYI